MNLKNIFGVVAFLFAFCCVASAQGVQRSPTFAIQNNGGYAKLIANAQVTLCVYNSNFACNTPVTIYQDQALTTPITYPFYADNNGNYSYYVQPGTYIEQVCAPQNQCYYYQITLSSGSGGGGGTPAGPTYSCQFNNSGIFGGVSGCLFNPGSDTLTIAGTGTTGVLSLSGSGGGTFSQTVPSSFANYTVTWPTAAPTTGAGYLNCQATPCVWSVGGSGSTPAAPSFAVQLANSGATAFQADSNILINPTLHQFTLGPQALPGTTPPTGAYGMYGGLPNLINVMVDCPRITGLTVNGDGSTDDWNALQQCIWQETNVCPTPGTACTPTDRRYNSSAPSADNPSLTFFFPQRNFTQHSGLGCSFYLSQGLDLPWDVRLEGEGEGISNEATMLCFAANQYGLYTRGYNGIRHIVLKGGNTFVATNVATFILPSGFGGTATGDGILAGGGSNIDDVSILDFPAHGIECNSSATWPGTPSSNECDINSINNVTTASNGGHGFYFHGDDANVATTSHLQANINQLYGFYDNALYASVFTGAAAQGNGQDNTTFSGTIPAITSTVCGSGICTQTAGSTTGLYAGDVIENSGCSDSGLNTVPFVVTPTSSTSYTFAYAPTETVTGCSAAYRIGTHIWAAAGNTVQGRGAAGGCVYGPVGHWIDTYCEGNQPYGSFLPGTGTGDLEVSLVEDPQGVAPYAPYGAKVATSNNLTTTSSAYDYPYMSTSALRQNDSDGHMLTFLNVAPSNSVTSQNSPFSYSYLQRTFYGPGPNGAGNLSNWDCFTLPGNLTETLSLASGCWPDETVEGLTAVGVTNGGSGYSSPTYTFVGTGGNSAGQGAAISCTNTGGVLGPCTVTATGAGYGSSISIKVYDPTGTGAVLAGTLGSVASTDSGRSALNGGGIWYVPKWLALGSLGNYMPQIVIGTCSAAPSSGSWDIGDTCINISPSAGGVWGWQNTAAGSPGTWTPLVFAGSGFTGTKTAGSCVMTITGGLITNVTGC
jgi:hypothetical protein